MTNIEQPIKSRQLWLIYFSLLVSGVMLIGDAIHIEFIARLTARLGGTLLFTAIFLIAGKGKPSGIIATSIIWLAFIITILK